MKVHSGDDVGLFGHGIFSKSVVDYTHAKPTAPKQQKSKKIKKKSSKLHGAGTKKVIKRRRRKNSRQLRVHRSKETLF